VQLFTHLPEELQSIFGQIWGFGQKCSVTLQASVQKVCFLHFLCKKYTFYFVRKGVFDQKVRALPEWAKCHSGEGFFWPKVRGNSPCLNFPF